MNYLSSTLRCCCGIAMFVVAFLASLSTAVFAKDTITNIHGATAVTVPPASIGDFNVGGPYSGPGMTTIPTVDLFLASSDLGEWWVNGSPTDPWTDLLASGTQFAYHHRGDVADGGTLWAAWSLEVQYFDYTSEFRHTDGQIPNGSIISFGLSDSGTPFSTDPNVWQISGFSGMSATDVAGGLDLSTYPGPSVADFSGAAAFTWMSYEITDGAVLGVPSGTDITWTMSQPTAPITDYVVFVELPTGDSIDADGGSFTTLSPSDMQGAGGTDEIVFNWTIDAKSNIVGEPNPEYGENIGVAAPLGDFVWVDLDRDGVQDPLEPGLAGVLVELLDISGDPVLDANSQPIQTTTDANGAYGLEDFNAGDYTLRFTPPAGQGYVATGTAQGGDDTLDSNINGSGVTGPITIGENESNSTVDAGYLPPESVIANFVFNDADLDGIQDAGETGIEGVTVNLLDGSGNPVLDGGGSPITTTTNADGVYFFAGLTAGTYIVEFETPENHAITLQDQLGDDALDSDIDPTTGRTGQIVLGANETNLTVDAGFYELPSIGDLVFNDEDGDGRQDAGETGIPGVTVKLLDSSGSPVLDGSNSPITTVTDGAGQYLFEGLDPGDYIIEFVTPSGFTTVSQDVDQSGADLATDSDYDPATGRTAVITVAAGEHNRDIDAGYEPPNSFARIGDLVWEDLNRDGIQDPGEPGLAGVTVKLLDGSGNPVTDSGGNPVTTTTDASGNYEFIVAPGSGYIIEFVPPSGTTVTVQDAGADDTLDSDADPATFRTGVVTPANDEVNLTLDAGIVPKILGDTVWLDANGDGVQDPEEAGLPGVTVELLDTGGNPVLDGGGYPITATTDSNGYYELTGFDSGLYTVRFTDPEGRVPTTADQGGDDTLDSDINASGVTGTIDMTGPGSNFTVDAGFLPIPPILGDYVWNDLDADGVYDPGEPGLAGVTVNLLDSNGDPALDGSGNPITTVTSPTGAYLFDQLAPGDYIIEVVPPQNYAVSPKDQGGDDALDSDVDPATFQSDVFTVLAATEDLTFDIGLFELGSIGDFVWIDEDVDGRQDAGEVGLPGVTVALLDGTGSPILDGSGTAVTTTSDANGFYQFTDLPAGNYILDFSTPNGFQTVLQDRDGNSVDTIDSDYNETTGQTAVISLGQGENNVDIDAGYDPIFGNFAQIGDTVWNDTNGDGIQDPGESGVEGIVVRLLDANGDPILDGDGNETTVTTDTNGNYNFVVDPDFDYILEFGTTPGDLISPQGAGSNPNEDSDIDPLTGRTGLIMIANDEIFTDIDAGIVVRDIIGDTVWMDLDQDGVQDPGEGGIGGVTVELLDEGGNPVPDGLGGFITTTTDANGYYELTGFAPGIYTVRFTDPGGRTPVSADQGGDDALDSDINASGVTGPIDMTSPGDDVTVDAGYLPTGSAIGDTVFNDLDFDGIQDPGEGGVEGVTVNLLDDLGNPVLDGGSPVTTTTDANGNYFFDGLSAGDYIVEVIPPQDYAVTLLNQGGNDSLDSDIDPATNRSGVINLAADTSDITVDAGLYELGSIGDFVWNDADNDGRQDAGEIGLPGVTVKLLDGSGNPVLDGNSQPVTTTSDASGFYQFTGLPAGNYIIEFVTPDGYQTVQQDRDNDDTIDSDYNETTGRTAVIALTQGEQNIDVDGGFDPTFGNFAQIGDTVWFDTNGDGIQDPGESGVEGVVVKLLDDQGNPVQDAGGNDTTVTTDANGNYLFIVDPSSDYILEFVPPAGNVLTLQGQGGNTAEDSDVNPATNRTGVIMVANNEVNLDLDAGLVVSLNTLGDFVWIDTNQDGIQDGSEVGINGVTVNLLDGSGNPTGMSTTTADNGGNPGFYEFTDLPDGDYIVEFVLPADYAFSPTGQGTSATDSNADPVTGRSGVISLSGGTDDDTVDAGLFPVFDISGQVRDDYDSDGDFSDADRVVGGVTVELYLDANTDGIAQPGELIETTTTDSNGDYLFEDLPEGNYLVREIDPVEATGSTGDTGPDNADANLIPVTLSGADSVGNNFLDAIDPAGYIYDSATGEIIPGGTISVVQDSGTPGTITISQDGSTGQYAWLVDQPGTYTMSYTPPARYVIDSTRPVSGPSYDVSPGPGTDVLGTYEDAGNPGYLTDPSAVSNPYYLTFVLDTGDQLVINNNIPLRKLKATNYAEYLDDAGLTAGTADGQLIPDGTGSGGNPDGDYHSNLIEHALCDSPVRGVSNHQGFCVDLVNPVTGQIDASFVRGEGIQDVIYTLQGKSALDGTWVDIASIAAGAAAASPFTVASNGDETETVTYADLGNSGVAGLTPEFGLVRLCVSLDSEPDGTPDTVNLPSDGSNVEATDYTETFGWQCTDFNATQCASCSYPFAPKPVFTGTIDSNLGAAITVSTSALGLDLGTVIAGGGVYYLQITSGAHEGERFDIASAGPDLLTLVSDPGIFAALDGVESLNTSDGLPADAALNGAAFQVLPHRTMDEVFDKNGAFAGLAGSTPANAARVLLYNNRLESPLFETYMLVDTGSEVKWIRSNDLATQTDQGGRRIDRADGFYIHPMLGGLTHCAVGIVADYDFAVALNEGYNLTGAPYPKDQAMADADAGAAIDGRDLQVATGLVGGITPTTSAQVFFWTGDLAVDEAAMYMTGYKSRMLLDGGGTQKWINPADPLLQDVGDEILLQSHRAATVKLPTGNTLKPHLYPVPSL